jgi:hypothetical protein
MHYVAEFGDEEFFDLIMENGGEKILETKESARGITPVFFSVSQDNVITLKRFIKEKVNINAKVNHIL